MLSEEFLEWMDDVREYEESGEFDEWLRSVPKDSELSEKLNMEGF